MVRSLVTGGTGFLGRYLVEHLAADGEEVVSTYFHEPRSTTHRPPDGVRTVRLDVTDGASVRRLLEAERPEIVYHLAGQAYVVPSWEDPAATFDVNLRGTLHVLESLRRTNPSCRLAFAGSGTEYGEPAEVPTPETAPLLPTSPYATSKSAADLLCYQYFRSFGIPTLRFRIFGTTGVGKRGDVCNDFASQIARLENDGAHPVMRVGALDKKRDIMDVHDTVRAMAVIARTGAAGEAYNIGCGEGRSVRGILESLRSMARVPISVEEESARLRRVDESTHVADVRRLRALGWSPEVPFADTLRGILDDWRHHPA